MTESPLSSAVEVVNKSPLMALVVELPSERILAASEPAIELLSRVATPVVGRAVTEFTTNPTSAADLLLAGRVNGYQTTRTLPTNEGDVVLQAWVRGIAGEQSPYAIAVLWPGHGKSDTLLPGLEGEDMPVVVGSSDADLVVDRICDDISEVTQRPASETLGRSLLRLVVPADTAALMFGVAEAARSGAGASVRVRVARADGESVWCQIMLTPLVPPPSLAFTIVPDRDEQELAGGAGAAERALWRLGSGMEGAAISRDLAEAAAGGAGDLHRLTTRELDIVGRLMTGDRVPAIATALFLSQSTVRNHLSGVFRKLKVSSQQELLDLLRAPGGTSGSPSGGAARHAARSPRAAGESRGTR
jgi:DNA-binding CsgD family transcriptional regulator